MSDVSDMLDNPAALWPTPTPPARPEPRRWVWEAMEPPERRQRLRELAQWVDWLRRAFALHNQIPSCWYRHPSVVEHLTALYAGWVRTYTDDQPPGRELAEADWINTLHNFTPRLQLAACATGRHQDPPPLVPPPPGAAEAFEVYLVTADATTSAAARPAGDEALRRTAKPQSPM